MWYLSARGQWKQSSEAFEQNYHVLIAFPLYVENVPGILLEFLYGLNGGNIFRRNACWSFYHRSFIREETEYNFCCFSTQNILFFSQNTTYGQITTIYRETVDFVSRYCYTTAVEGGKQMQIEIKIDEYCTEPKIIIVTNKVTDEVNEIMKKTCRRANTNDCRLSR